MRLNNRPNKKSVLESLLQLSLLLTRTDKLSDLRQYHKEISTAAKLLTDFASNLGCDAPTSDTEPAWWHMQLLNYILPDGLDPDLPLDRKNRTVRRFIDCLNAIPDFTTYQQFMASILPENHELLMKPRPGRTDDKPQPTAMSVEQRQLCAAEAIQFLRQPDRIRYILDGESGFNDLTIGARTALLKNNICIPDDLYRVVVPLHIVEQKDAALLSAYMAAAEHPCDLNARTCQELINTGLDNRLILANKPRSNNQPPVCESPQNSEQHRHYLIATINGGQLGNIKTETSLKDAVHTTNRLLLQYMVQHGVSPESTHLTRGTTWDYASENTPRAFCTHWSNFVIEIRDLGKSKESEA